MSIDSVSRRSFLKRSLVVSAVAPLARTRSLSSAQGRPLIPRAALTFTVNGEPQRVEVEDHWTLVEVLRDELGLTGTKIGCDRAECGACTVLVDGVPYYSCSLLTHSVRGREVTSIEGLEAEDGTLHPMQQAVLEEQGFQCAFCMSGFIMNTVALLNENSSPTRKDAAEWLSGNLCRCADYDKILTSVMRAAEITRGA